MLFYQTGQEITRPHVVKFIGTAFQIHTQGLNNHLMARLTIRFEDINKNLDLLRVGDMVGRAVVRY